MMMFTGTMNGNTRDICYTLVDSSYYRKMSEMNLKYCLEYGSVESKREAMKEVIVSTANGDCNNTYLILIIRFILPMQDHMIKKLLLIFWELYPKTGCDGELIKEMILVCDAFRKDLQHPNEYVRGSTLRFLCKLKQPEILEPLISSVRGCLNHPRPYVRRNTVLAIYAIYKNYDYLIPDAPELVENFLKNEKDMSCKRNAFIMLLNSDVDKAVSYLMASLDQVCLFDQSLQIITVELIQTICRTNSHEKSAFIRCIYSLLDSKSHAVRYEAARTLIMLTNAPTAQKASINCYIDIILRANDNTAKLITLDRLVDMKYHLQQKRILQECVSEILGLIPRNNDTSLKIKIVNLVLDLITENHISQMVNILKKECSKNEKSLEYNNYKVLLTQKLQDCNLKFPIAANEIIPFFNDLLTVENDEKILLNILILLREAAQKFKPVQSIIVKKLKDSLSTVSSLEVFNKTLWILVEFTDNCLDMENILDELYEIIKETGDIFKEEQQNLEAKIAGKTNDSRHVLNNEIRALSWGKLIKPLMEDISMNTGFVGSAIGWCTAKLVLSYSRSINRTNLKNHIINKGMYIITTILNINKTKKNMDSFNRLSNCLNLLMIQNKDLVDQLLVGSKVSLLQMLNCQSICDEEEMDRRIQMMQPDDPIGMLLAIDRPTQDMSQLNSFNHFQADEFDCSFKLDKIIQLTGLSDPVYAETKLVHTNEQNIALFLSLLNRTEETLQNCFVELVSSGDLIITDRPQAKTIEPNGRADIRVDVKVALTGNSIIFGNIVYDTAKTTEHKTIVLNDIPIDVIDYIKPSDCLHEDFRKMWLEFEWENKVYLSPKTIKDLTEFLTIVTKSLRMKCLTPKEAMSGEGRFLTANLHAVSIFGESVIANLSLEKDDSLEKITGHIRLRAKSQGIVLGLGDKIRYSQC